MLYCNNKKINVSLLMYHPSLFPANLVKHATKNEREISRKRDRNAARLIVHAS